MEFTVREIELIKEALENLSFEYFKTQLKDGLKTSKEIDNIEEKFINYESKE